MAWIKFRFFEPLSHPDCVVITPSSTTPLVTWCAERALKDISHMESLSREQLHALEKASEIAGDSYSANEFQCISHLAQRMVWGSPFKTSVAATAHPPPPMQAAGWNLFGPPAVPNNPSGFFANSGPLPGALPGGLFGANPFSFLGRRRARIHDRWDILDKIRERITSQEARELVSKDNELRTLAALSMSEEAKNLSIKDSCELRIYFALQESALKITALTSSSQITPNSITGRN
jgi:hypothetical protein